MVKKTPVFEKEKIIDRRIGIRLNTVYWPVDRTSITEILNKLNYKDLAATRTGSLNAIKQNTEFYTDYSKIVFGFHNPIINTLIEAQKEFFSVVQRDFKTDLSKFVRFYEIDCISHFISDKNSVSAISSVVDDSQIKREFEEILGESLQSSKLEFSKRGEGLRSDDWLTIEITPLVESIGNIYYCRVIKRAKSLNTLYQLLRKSSDLFEKLISKIEG